MTKEERIQLLEDRIGEQAGQIKTLQDDIRKLKLENSDLDERVKMSGQIQESTQPLLGRLIAMCVVLQKKGHFNEQDLINVQEYQADCFVEAAGERSPKEVRDRSKQAGNLADSSGISGSGVSGAPSSGGIEQGDTVSKDGERTGPTGLSDVRAAHGPSNRIINISEAKKKDLPSGQ